MLFSFVMPYHSNIKTDMKKIVAVFSSADSGGGAGLLADCRAVASAGCRPLAVVLGISAQNLDNFFGLWQVPPSVVESQFSALAAASVAAVKIGMLAGNAAAVGKCIKRIKDINKNDRVPVVWDPVFVSTAPLAGKLATATKQTADMINARRRLAPCAFVITPNRAELMALTGERSISAGLRVLFADGARNVLITGINERGGKLRHCLYSADNASTPTWDVVCDKRRGLYHGSGCLLSSLMAAYLAKGASAVAACSLAHRRVLAAIDKAQNAPEGYGRRQKLLPQ